jgi:hypothetical protein
MSNSSSSFSSSDTPSDKHGIKLKRYIQTKYVINNIDGFRMKVEALDANGMSNAIFRYLRGPLSASTGAYQDDFDGICSPSDLEEFYENAPEPGANPAWFRKTYVDLVFRSQATANEAWEMMLSDVKILVKTMDTMEVIQPEITVSIGDPLN